MKLNQKSKGILKLTFLFQLVTQLQQLGTHWDMNMNYSKTSS